MIEGIKNKNFFFDFRGWPYTFLIILVKIGQCCWVRFLCASDSCATHTFCVYIHRVTYKNIVIQLIYLILSLLGGKPPRSPFNTMYVYVLHKVQPKVCILLTHMINVYILDSLSWYTCFLYAP